MSEHDQEDDGLELKRYEWDLTSPLERAKASEEWRLRRMEALEEVIKGPALHQDWVQANEEFQDLRRGYRLDDEEFGW